jgi:hypothetical protein
LDLLYMQTKCTNLCGPCGLLVSFPCFVVFCVALLHLQLFTCRYGDNIRSSWSNMLELVLRLEKLDLLPPALEALIDADVWGVGPPGAPSPTKLTPAQLPAGAGAATAAANGASAAAAGASTPGPAAAAAAGQQQQQPGVAAGSPAVSRPLQSARQRRAAAGTSGSRGRGGGVGGGFLRSVTQLIALQEPEYEAKYATQVCVCTSSVSVFVLLILWGAWLGGFVE